MIRSLLMGRADLAASSLTLNPERFTAIDYLFPMGTETYAIYISNPDQESIDWNIYKEPFSLELWVFLGMAVVLLAVLMRVVDNM